MTVQYFTIPWTNALIGGGFRLGRPAMIDALRASLKRLDVQQLDLWQVQPFSLMLKFQRWCSNLYTHSTLMSKALQSTDLHFVYTCMSSFTCDHLTKSAISSSTHIQLIYVGI